MNRCAIKTFNDINEKLKDSDIDKNIVSEELSTSIILNNMIKDKKSDNSILKYASLIHENNGIVDVVDVKQDETYQLNIVGFDESNNVNNIVLSNGAEYSFEKSSGTSVDGSVYIESMEHLDTYSVRNSAEIISNIINKESSNVLFFSDGKLNTLKKGNYEEITNELWNNPDNMKDFFEIMVSNDELDNDHTEYLRGLLSKMTDKTSPIFNEFKLYVSKNANKNVGVAKISKDHSFLKLDISKTTASSTDSAQKVYMHELIHLSLEFARQYKKGEIGTINEKLGKLYEQSSSEITEEKLAKYTTKKHAKKLYKQMFMEKNGMSEFIALGMTEEAVISVLKDLKVADKNNKLQKNSSIFDYISHYIHALMDVFKKTINAKSLDGDEALRLYVSKLWEHNSLTVKNETLYQKILSKSGKAKNLANKAIVKTITTIAAPIDKYSDMFIESNKHNIFGQTLGTTKNLLGIFNVWQSPEKKRIINATLSDWSKSMETSTGLNIGWLIAPENAFNKIMNHLKPGDKLTNTLEELGLITQRFDGDREDTKSRVGEKVKNSFSKLTRSDQKLLTSVLIETDVQSLLVSYTVDEIIGLLSDSAKLSDAIKNEHDIIGKHVSDSKVKYYYLNQAKALGIKLSTGKSGSSFSGSAFDITAIKNTDIISSELSGRNFKEVMYSIDRLATLEALSIVDDSDKQTVSMLDSSGIKTVLAVHMSFHKEAVKYAKTSGSNVYPSKGEIKDTQEDGVDVKIGFKNDDIIKDMKSNGYKIAGETAVSGISYFVNKNKNINTFKKQAFAKINDGKRLHSIIGLRKDLGKYYDDTLNRLITDKMEKEIRRQTKSIVDPLVDGYVRIPRHDGSSTFGVSIDKADYAKSTLQDNKAPILLGKMIAEIEEKAKSAKINDKVFSVMLKDSANYKRSESFNSGYIELGPDAKTRGVTESNYSKMLYNNLPFSVKKKIFGRKDGQRYIAVRRDIASMYTGNRVPSIMNLRIPYVDKTIGRLLEKNNVTKTIRNFMDVSSTIWKDIVSLQKMDIVIRTPAVLQNNIISNANWSVTYGQTPWATLNDQLDMIKETKTYRERDREVKKLQLSLKVDDLSPEDKIVNEKKIIVLKQLMENTLVHDLFEANLFSSIMGDISDKDLIASSKLEKIIEQNDTVKKIAEKTPKIIKDGLSVLYMTEGTKLFDAMHESMIYSDFVARAALYKYLVETKGISKHVAIRTITRAFVNYNWNLPEVLQSLEVNGVEWFMQYAIGANKDLFARVKEDPFPVLAMSMFLDAPNPSDAFVLNKDFGMSFRGPFDVAIDGSLKNIVSPSMLQIAGIID